MATIQKQVRMVFDLNKCIGCHTCTMGCKTMWTDGRVDLPAPAVPGGSPGLDPLKGGKGLLYQYWNNVSTSPGRDYPRGIFTPTLGGGFDPVTGLIDLSGQLPSIEKDYGAAWEYNYDQVLMTSGGNASASTLTLTPSPDGNDAYSSNWDEDVATGNYPNSYYFYLPRLCNHCDNPGCVAACPKQAPYKREEDGIVLIDQVRCDGYRFCNQGCPYKKPYYNPELKKSQKCIFCYPRLEQEPGSHNAPQPPRENFCFNQCVGRIRFVGYNNPNISPMDAVNQAKNVNKLVDKWGVALRLHPEYGTVPNLFYIPPLSPPTFDASGNLQNDMRVPVDFLASLFGDNASQTHAQRVARVNEIFNILRTEKAKAAAGGSSELVDILNAHAETDRLQLYLG
jgi:DMSO reductase family type II enzyme iron-sulfur subunit